MQHIYNLSPTETKQWHADGSVDKRAKKHAGRSHRELIKEHATRQMKAIGAKTYVIQDPITNEDLYHGF